MKTAKVIVVCCLALAGLGPTIAWAVEPGDFLLVDRRADPLNFTPNAGESDNPGALFGMALDANGAPTVYVVSEPDPNGPLPTFNDIRSVAVKGSGDFVTLHRGDELAIPPVPGFLLGVAQDGTTTLIPPTDPATWNPLFMEDAAGERGMENIVVDRNGDYLFTHSRADVRCVFRMTPSGDVSFVSTDGTFSQPRGILVDLCGNLIVADSGPDALVTVDPAGNVGFNAEILVQHVEGDEPWSKIRDVALDSQGDYIVVDEASGGAVWHVDRHTLVVTKVASHDPLFSRPRSIAVGANGNYYMVDRDLDTIFEIAPFPAVDQITPIVSDPNLFADLINIRANRQLVDLEMTAPPSIDECDSVPITATAFFNDGFVLDVGTCANLELVSLVPEGTTLEDGVLTAGAVEEDVAIVIRCHFGDKGIQLTRHGIIYILEAGIATCGLDGDCDDDGDVDLLDFITFQTCYTGPGGGPVGPECYCADFDDDGDVDLLDFLAFQVAYTGPGGP